MICSKCHNLGNDIFTLEERQFSRKDIVDASYRLENLLKVLGNRRFERMSLSARIGWLNRILFREHGFRFRCLNRDRSFPLTGTLLDGGGNCLGLTTLYVVIGQSLNIPLLPVLYEGHIAACVDLAGQVQPIEVSRGGALLRGRIAEFMYTGRGVQQVLSDEHFLAVHMANQAAFVWAPRGDYATALSLLRQSLELFPSYVGGWINLAALHLRCGDLNQATIALERVLELSPTGPYLRHALTMLDYIVCGKLPEEYHVV